MNISSKQSRTFLLLLCAILLSGTNGVAQEIWQKGTAIIKLKNEKNGDKKSLKATAVQRSFAKIGVKRTRQLFPNSSTQKRNNNFRLNDIYQISFDETQNVETVLQELSQESWIEYVEPSYLYFPLGDPPNDEYADRHWGHTVAKVYDAWDITMGSPNVIIGLVDQGFKLNHPDLKNQFA